MRKIVNKKKDGKKRKPLFQNQTLIFLSIALFLSMVVMLYQAQQIQNLRGNAQTTNCTVPTEELTFDSEEKVLFDKVNAYRQEKGKQPLKQSPSLTRAAAWLSADMSSNKKLNHTDSLGRTMQTRLAQCGYPGTTSGGSENIASTGTSAESAFNAWKNSTQGHNENMLNERWTVMGVSRNGTYWTYTAGATDDSTSTAPTNPPAQIPSPVCLGACATPSIAPISPTIPQTVTGQPTSEPLPTAPQATQTPDDEQIDTPPVNPDEKGGRTNGGIIGLFLEFIIRFLELLSSIFRRE